MVAPAMTGLAKIAAPIVWVLSKSGKFVLTALGQNSIKQEIITDVEIHALIAEAESVGAIEPEERDMIAGVMRLGDRQVKAIMTPRADVQLIDVNEPLTSLGKRIHESGHSRFVVYDKNQDNIIGVVQVKDVAIAVLGKGKSSIRKLIDRPSPHASFTRTT